MLPALFTPQFMTQLELLQFKTKRAFLGSRQGGHISPRKGHGIEFSEYRKYELGDSPRHIDWGVYARTDRLYVKRFLEEEDLSVLIMLDASRSMFEPDPAQKWERARDVGLALSYVALSEHDTVRMTALGAYHSARMTSLRSVHVLSKELDDVLLQSKWTSDRELAPHVLTACSKVRYPGVAILVSDCFIEFHQLETALNALRAKNLMITLVHILGMQDIEPLAPGETGKIIDSENDEEIEINWSPDDQKDYKKRLEMHAGTIEQFCRASGIQYAQLTPEMNLADFIMAELPSLGILA